MGVTAGANPQDELGILLDKLTSEVYIGRMHLWIWRHFNNLLVQEPDVSRVADVFFKLTLRAHVDEAFLHLARLLDPDRRSVGLRSLQSVARKYVGRFRTASKTKVTKELLPTLEKELKAMEVAGRPILARRNSILAHLDPKAITDLASLEKEWAITVGDMEQLYKRAGELVNEVSGAYRNSETLMEIIDWDDFRNVVRYMKLGRQAEREEFEKKWPRRKPEPAKG